MNVGLIVIGIYFVLVAHAQNADAFFTSVVADKGFGLWLIALAVAYLISKAPNMNGIANALIALALVALMITSWPNVSAQSSELYTALGG